MPRGVAGPLTTNPVGRPLKIDKVIDRREDGTPVTIGERIIELTRTVWAPHRFTAAHANLTADGLEKWIRQGSQAREAMVRGEKVTANQRRLAKFVTELEKAEAEAVAARLGTIQGAAAGGWVKRKTVTKTDAEGNEEVTVTEETIPPEWTAAAWQLERRLRSEFGRTLNAEVTGKDGSPLIPKEDRAGQLAASLEGFLAGADAQRERDGERADAEG